MALIYDVGMNNGDDTEYYLAKGADVVAVEADPLLCAAAAERFAPEVAAGRLQIVNAAVGGTRGQATFYRHWEQSEWGTLVEPEQDLDRWERIPVDVVPLAEIVEPGPHVDHVKIDIEGYDLQALRSLDLARIVPPYVSIEAKTVQVPCLLIAMGYTHFRLVNCKTQRKKVRRVAITRFGEDTKVEYEFGQSSSGPYGPDSRQPWYSADQLMQLWPGRTTMLGRGWFDVHATCR